MLVRLSLVLIFSAMAAFSQMPPVEPGVSQGLAKWRAAHYSDVRYKLNLTLEKMSPVLKGTIEIRVKLTEPPSKPATSNPTLEADASAFRDAAIILDWRKIAGHEQLSTLSNVSINGKALLSAIPSNPTVRDYDPTFQESNEHLIFRDGVVAGENVIKLDFTSPILTSASAITRYVDKEDGAEYIYSLFVPSDASTAFPVFDQPDLKARFSLDAKVPIGWKIVSNGNVKKFDISKISFSFGQTPPISTYVFAFAAGPWDEVSASFAVAGALSWSSWNSGATIQSPATAADYYKRDADEPLSSIFVRKSQTEKFKPHAAEVLRLNRDGIKYLETYFDYKFPFPKYDIVLIPEFPFGGMEHAGATFLRENRVIFPQEPTKNDYITRANVIFHEAAHQWFGDTVTMKWFDDLWLKEGFAEFMAYKTLERVMPEYNAWKVFYERNKQAAYLTDSTKGTTPIYQEIANLNAAKSAYGNIVYRKAPSFLKQAEFYLGPDKFQKAVRAFLKKHEYANAGWEDLVKEFEAASGRDLKDWANVWVKNSGLPKTKPFSIKFLDGQVWEFDQYDSERKYSDWEMSFKTLFIFANGEKKISDCQLGRLNVSRQATIINDGAVLAFPNYEDYGYGIFLLDDKSRDYVLKNIQNEKDDFLRTMMWGSLWDSVREGEMDPREYVALVIKNLTTEQDESTVATLLGRVSTAMNYYLPDAERTAIAPRLEAVLIDRMQKAPTLGQRITFYRAFLNVASRENARNVLKQMLKGGNPSGSEGVPNVVGTQAKNTLPTGRVSAFIPLKTKDRFDIVTRLLILNDPEAPKLLAELEKTETSDEAKRYAYAARAGIATMESKAKFWADYTTNKDVSESWIEASLGAFNSTKHSHLTLSYLERALAELPNLKRTRKIFFVNNWLGAFIGGQRSEEALAIVNKFLADNPNLDRDLRLKIFENVDLIERAIKIRAKYGKTQS